MAFNPEHSTAISVSSSFSIQCSMFISPSAQPLDQKIKKDAWRRIESLNAVASLVKKGALPVLTILNSLALYNPNKRSFFNSDVSRFFSIKFVFP
ncbi:MAG: hypothetical protein JRI67_10365 [Deltaproteobacteria bacterium]|nr:hypothetical protein [Deltaproteobacteria bacterium]